MMEICLIYEVKCTICDAIYIGNTQKTFKNIMDVHLSDVELIFNNRKKFKQINPIGANK